VNYPFKQGLTFGIYERGLHLGWWSNLIESTLARQPIIKCIGVYLIKYSCAL